eukprot:m.21075 g.21075  ORF g.21075 m.21075 type:complete len:950 (+) comp28134_c0_seq3:11-2860(+)
MQSQRFKGPKQHRPELARSSGSLIRRDEAMKRELGFDSDSAEDSEDHNDSPGEEEEEGTRLGNDANWRIKGRLVDGAVQNRKMGEIQIALKISQSDLRKCRQELNRMKNSKASQLKLLKKAHADSLAEQQKLIEELKDLIDEKMETIQDLEARLQGGGQLGQMRTRTSGMKNLVDQISKLHGDKLALNERVVMIQCQLGEMKDEVEVTRKEMDTLKEEMMALGMGEKMTVSQPVKVSTQDLEKKEEELKCLQEANQKLRVQVEEKEKVSQEAATAELGKSKKMGIEIEKLKSELQQVKLKSEADKDAREKTMSELKRELKDAQRTTEEMQKNMTGSEAELKRGLRDAQQANEKVQKKLDASETSKKDQNRITKILQEKIKGLEGDVVQYKALTEQQGKERGDVVKENAKLRVQVAEVKSKVGELESAVEALNHLGEERESDLLKLQAERRGLHQDLATVSADLKSSREQTTKAAEDKEKAIIELRRQMDEASQDLKRRLKYIAMHVSGVGREMQSSRDAYKTLRDEHQVLHASIGMSFREVKAKTAKAIRDIDETNKLLVSKYKQEMALRKKLHNEVIELKGNIRVFCRVRPTIKEDGQGMQAKHVVTFDFDDDQLVNVFSRGTNRPFEMDSVFRPDSAQEKIFSEVKNLITSCMDGFDVCIFAYGQTGSGKTYTMEGPTDNPGVNPRALEELFAVAKARNLDWTYEITMSVIEIYNEQIRDLLGDNPTAKMDIRQHPEGYLYVPGLCWVQVASRADVQEVFSMGRENRATACTNMNEHSSRSHALLCVKVEGRNKTTGAKTLGKLNLIDLAGSERVAKSGTEGERLKEAQNINKSLSSLGDVIHSLKNKSSHVPFRNSKLTYLLQDSLSGNSKTLMIVHVAPVEKNAGETINSLTFASRVRTVELGQATRKTQSAEIAELRERLRLYEDPTAVSQVTGLPKRTAGKKK